MNLAPERGPQTAFRERAAYLPYLQTTAVSAQSVPLQGIAVKGQDGNNTSALAYTMVKTSIEVLMYDGRCICHGHHKTALFLWNKLVRSVEFSTFILYPFLKFMVAFIIISADIDIAVIFPGKNSWGIICFKTHV